MDSVKTLPPITSSSAVVVNAAAAAAETMVVVEASGPTAALLPSSTTTSVDGVSNTPRTNNNIAMSNSVAAKANRRWKSSNGERQRDAFGYRLRAAGACARRNEHVLEFLLVSAQRGPHHWVIPGGGIEHGEPIRQAVLREVVEEAGVQCDILEVVGEFKDNERLHRTTLFLLRASCEMDEWEDGRHGRQRRWFAFAEALEVVKPSQRRMLELSARRIAEIENTARSAR